MSDTPPNPFGNSARWLGAGLTVSLLLHLSVGVLLVASARPTLEIRTPNQEVRDDSPPRPRLRLGLEESPVASINWLGFADPTEHAAPVLFEVDQAALARNVADPSPPDPSRLPNVPTSPAPSESDPIPAPPTPAPPVEQVTEPADPAPAVLSPAAPEQDSPVVIQPPTDSPSTEPDAPNESTEPEEVTPTESATPPPAPPAPEGPLVPASTPPAPLAIPDDRDSTPAAKEMSLTLDRLGKPAAGEGVELQTVRLGSQDKAVRMLVGSLKNPVVLLEFKREKEGPATASLVEFARDEQPDGTVLTRNTGSADIDRIMRLNFYRWTATGKAIDELEVGKTLQIRLSIHLH